ncbi:MAG TPA: aminotransferase class IV [Propionibacteriaceae bacterium]|nr:aminotransferase class IV [Propionibacteriaceae bacterium]
MLSISASIDCEKPPAEPGVAATLQTATLVSLAAGFRARRLEGERSAHSCLRHVDTAFPIGRGAREPSPRAARLRSGREAHTVPGWATDSAIECPETASRGSPGTPGGTARRRIDNRPEHARCRLAIRVRARPSYGGLDISFDASPLGPPPASSTLHYQSRPDRSWRHKWIERSAMTEAEAAASPAQPFFTSRARPHEMTETSRGNLFMQDQNGFWCTPPLDEQVLPGVTRREVLDLLADRRTPARIRRCAVQELRQSRGAFWTSSLSGAVPITSVDGTVLPDVSEFTAELNDQLGIR